MVLPPKSEAPNPSIPNEDFVGTSNDFLSLPGSPPPSPFVALDNTSFTENEDMPGPFKLLSADLGSDLGAIFDVEGKPAPSLLFASGLSALTAFFEKGFVGALSGIGGKALLEEVFFSLGLSVFVSVLPLRCLDGGFGDPPSLATSNDPLTFSGVVPNRSKALRDAPAKVTSSRPCGNDTGSCLALSNSETVSHPDLVESDVGGDMMFFSAKTIWREDVAVAEGGNK